MRIGDFQIYAFRDEFVWYPVIVKHRWYDWEILFWWWDITIKSRDKYKVEGFK